MEIIAHRGASFDAPENTLKAFRLAWEQGADAIECDVRMSADGEIVVVHDQNLMRLAGVDANVADLTLAELCQFNVLGEPIPTLGEVLALVPPGKRALIEVKCGPEIVPELQRTLVASRLEPRQTCVIAFSPDVIAKVKAELRDHAAYWIVRLRNEDKTWAIEELIEQARNMDADALDLSDDLMITNEFVARARRENLLIYVWTVNDSERAATLREAGVAGVATDRPGWLREGLGKK